MAYTTDQLYRLLPAIYRIRDAERGEPLRALIAVLAEQAAILEQDIERLYENGFIETCDEWVVPYIGDLLGVRGLHQISGASFSQRARVANTLGYRRRKGTASMLEQLARDTTGWPARAVEFFQVLGTTQYINHVRLGNVRTPNLRGGETLELLGGPFDTIAHSVDVRHIDTGRGRHNIMNVGLFLWRLQAYAVPRSPAYSHGDGCFSFNQLGQDAPLFNHPITEIDPAHLATELNVPGPVRRSALHSSLASNEERLYGENLSLRVWVDGKAVERERVVMCNLSGFEHRPRKERVAVDPVLGRIALPAGENASAVHVEYYYGFAADVGGGSYERSLTASDQRARRYPVAKSSANDTLQKALDQWVEEGRRNAVIEIEDSEQYEESPHLTIPAGRTLEIRAAGGSRPVLRLNGAMAIAGAALDDPREVGARLILDGLLVTGGRIEIRSGALDALEIRHCTLVPGWSLQLDGTPRNPRRASLVVLGGNEQLKISVMRTISGRLHLPGIERVSLTDSIVDGLDDAALEVTRLLAKQSTVLGPVHATVIELASNCIFTDDVFAERKQEGCVRFCYLPFGSRVPRRFCCEPETTIGREIEQARKSGRAFDREQIREAVRKRLQPRFTHRRYGQPGYGQLHVDGAVEIRRAADDQGELGVFHHLQQTQREANLLASLSEYLRIGLEAGLCYVT